MKESITKFDLEAAFKALDEISTPKVEKGIKANKPALTEIFSRKSKFDALFEEYYDVGNMEDLSDAKDTRAAEIAKAKLARIEKIVDLDAESPEDLLPSYVGKFIMQCPQCMTLFYKNPEDIEESEDDEKTVNVNEVCQHCGNNSGYTLIGKVGEASSDEENPDDLNDESELELLGDEDNAKDEMTSEEENTENPEAEEELADIEDLELVDDESEELDLVIEDDETEANESWQNSFTHNTSLQENLIEAPELETSIDDFERLINTPEFKKPISDKEVRAMLATMNDLDEAVDTSDILEEGIFDKIKDKVTKTVDKVITSLKSREAKADWILANAREDYTSIKTDAEGQLVPDEDNKRFNTFIVIGFTNKYSSGKTITTAPSFNNKDLVVGKNGIQEKKHYKDADNIAKGWSQANGNGPAFIYLAKDRNDAEAVFLCEYFEGELKQDQLEKYLNVVKKDLQGAKLMAKGGMNQKEEEDDESTNSGISDYIDQEQIPIPSETRKKAATENLNAVMTDLEELQEASLEALIAKSLTEAYGNVAGFKLKDCRYLNEQFTVDGTIYFNSGNRRETTYTFVEALNIKNNKIKFCGFNEKLGLDKQFIITGHADETNRTFIAESFKYIKK